MGFFKETINRAQQFVGLVFLKCELSQLPTTYLSHCRDLFLMRFLLYVCLGAAETHCQETNCFENEKLYRIIFIILALFKSLGLSFFLDLCVLGVEKYTSAGSKGHQFTSDLFLLKTGGEI